MKSNRLYFRPFELDDYQDVIDILGNPNVCKYLPGNNEKTEEEIEKWHTHFMRSFDDEKGNKIFAILEQGNEKVIGYGGLSYVKEFDKIEIMYGFNQSVWGKGFATETSLRLKELAIELGIEELIALADIGNIPSQKVLLNTGFKLQDQIHIWGIDCYFYEMSLSK